MKKWAPSWLGRRLTGSAEWRLLQDGPSLVLITAGQTFAIDVEDDSTYLVRRGYFWTDITLGSGDNGTVRVDGLPNVLGSTLMDAMAEVAADCLQQHISCLRAVHRAMDDWLGRLYDEVAAAKAQRRWFTHEQRSALEATRPAGDSSDIRRRLGRPGVQLALGDEAAALDKSLAMWEEDLAIFWRNLNEFHTQRELEACKDLFDRVESRPLTEEQSRAVICFENRVQVVASAGSGKTSTMVAKAAYAIHRGFVAPKRIVMLAFNKKAAEELKVRATRSFERLGMQGIEVEANTFHALGLKIIGRATGEKPKIPDWAADNAMGDVKLNELIDHLKDQSPTFRTTWDLFRFVFGRDLPTVDEANVATVRDGQARKRVLTANGEWVRSQEEAMIANWLFLNGVRYVYERPYEIRTADEEHGQYHPDFYYPDVSLYHEHLALDAAGAAPPAFRGYLDGVAWKRKLHAQHHTALFETTSHGIRNGNDFQRLEAEFARRGIALDPNPDRPLPSDGQRPMESAELVRLIRTFISHTKSNCLTIQELRQRLTTMPEATFKHRHRMFLDIAEPILKAWNAALVEERGIDFEDMLNMAAAHLEKAACVASYELVMADEFQDASQARARLCRALVKQPGRYLFAVGDDWQSINRFAGADVSVMAGFQEFFGHGTVLKLEQTFRCPQELCDVSSRFVSRNPAQIPKQVRSAAWAVGPVLQAYQVDHQVALAGAIERFLEKIAFDVRDGRIEPGRDGKLTIYVLGRYNADRQYVPDDHKRFERWVDVSFLTIHQSKGCEADIVILPEMLSLHRGRSFPNTQGDDPLLALAMPPKDDYPLGEERRLFYVALTRAKRSVALFTVKGQRSVFLSELEADGALVISGANGSTVVEESCPICGTGIVKQHKGRYGAFSACSRYPACQYKQVAKLHERTKKRGGQTPAR